MKQQQLVCPVCQSPYQAQDTACTICGLIFSSYAGAAMGTTISHHPAATAASPYACPHCGNPTNPNAKMCGKCGNPLVYQYTQLQPGQSLATGRYTIQRALSKGGMGAIYLANDHDAFDRTVVIKAMLDYFDPSNPQEVQEAQQRFQYEAKTLSTLRHSAIPQIYTYFQDGAHNYIVMEYIEGDDLAQHLTRFDKTTQQTIAGTPYPKEKVIRWGITLCHVLEYLAGLHPNPVVHHDIKPANVVLDRNSYAIRLVDFGTAKARLLVQQSGGVGVKKSSVFGTQGYAPPEQYQGMSEARSDVYALAATLYHLATDDDPGGHPFSFPHLSQLGQLGQVLAHALQSDVQHRPSASELRQQLETLIAPAGAKPIEAPDGTELYHEQEIVAWCEQHWKDAAKWLYRSLPEQIENVWGKSKLAQDVRNVMKKQQGNRYAALDAVLALLDPSGFGKELPHLRSSKNALDFGSLKVGGKSDEVPLMLTNKSRRVLSVHVQHPKWLTSNRSKVTLFPGQRKYVKFTADMAKAKLGDSLNDTVSLEAGSATLLTIPASAQVTQPQKWNGMFFTFTGSVLGFINGAILAQVFEDYWLLEHSSIAALIGDVFLSHPFRLLFFVVPLIFLAKGMKKSNTKHILLALVSFVSFFALLLVLFGMLLGSGFGAVLSIAACFMVGAVMGFARGSNVLLKQSNNELPQGFIGMIVGSIVTGVGGSILFLAINLILHAILSPIIASPTNLGLLYGAMGGFVVDGYGLVERIRAKQLAKRIV